MISLSDSQKKEIYRKSIHISSLLMPLSYRFLLGYNKMYALSIFLPLAIISFTLDFIRLERKSIKKSFYRMFGIMLRKHEVSNFTGASYLLTSTVFCIALFPAEIAFIALSFLSIGDTFAALIGISFGRRTILNTGKSLEGSLACFISCLSFALLVGMNPVIALIGAYFATLAEILHIPIDDNIKVPILSGLAMFIVSVFV